MMTTQKVSEFGAERIEGFLNENSKSVDITIPLQELFDGFMVFISKAEM
ncbi:hypothetical protein J6S88_02140 [bacterium]|nr:hypothetical protein [bacterium]